jgi:predicted 3-demethylubiquinone-9 3-methyltransferase (glyoxalase superfamily)
MITSVMASAAKITPFFWIPGQGGDPVEELQAAVGFYAAAFTDGRPGGVRPIIGAPMAIASFSAAGSSFRIMLGGGPEAPNDSVSFMVHCEDQAEVDALWTRLGEGGEEIACGWLKDRHGIRWQIVPSEVMGFLESDDAEAVGRMMAEMQKMVKLDLEALRAAFEG